MIYILNLFNRKKYKFFIYGNNFRLKDQFNLAFKLRQLPMIRAQIKEKINRKINDKLRESFRKKLNLEINLIIFVLIRFVTFCRRYF